MGFKHSDWTPIVFYVTQKLEGGSGVAGLGMPEIVTGDGWRLATALIAHLP